jgi:hypothetical protein
VRAVVRSSVPGELVIECPIGQIAGAWRESSPSPQAGQWIDVEFDIDHVIYATDVIDVKNQIVSLLWESNVNYIVGCLESMDGDGMGYLRIAADCLLMLDTDGALVPGQWVQLRVPPSSVGIYGGAVM